MPCPVCGSVVSEPCKTDKGYHTDTHYKRREAYRVAKKTEELTNALALAEKKEDYAR